MLLLTKTINQELMITNIARFELMNYMEVVYRAVAEHPSIIACLDTELDAQRIP